MKTLLMTGLMLSSSLYAAPVVNKNISTKGSLVTIWPDHLDPDQFYFAPKSLKLSQEEDGSVKFNAFKYKTPGCGLLSRCHNAHISSFYRADFADHDLDEQISVIRQTKPKARFSPVSYMISKVNFSKLLAPFIVDHECDGYGGQAMDEVSCSMILNKKGIKEIISRFNNRRPVVFHFDYTISGVVEGENPRYRNEDRTYSVSVNMAGDDLFNHPDLEQFR